MECPIHKDNILTMVCVSCDKVLMCETCIDEHADEHADEHVYQPRKVVARKISEDFQKALDSNAAEIYDLTQKLKEINADQNRQDDIIEEESDRINKQRLEVHSVADEIAGNQRQFLFEQKQKNIPVFKDTIARLLSLLKDRSVYETKINSILKSNDVEVIRQSKLVSPPTPMLIPQFSLQPIEFCEGQTDKDEIQRMMGRVTGSPEEKGVVSDIVGSLRIQQQHAVPDSDGFLPHHQALSSSSTFSHKGSSEFAFRINPFNTNRMWIKWALESNIELSDREGNVMQIIRFSNEIFGFRTTQSQELLVCGYEDKCIYQVQYGCEPKVCFRTQLRPLDVYPLDDGDLIVSVGDSYDFGRTSKSKRMVLKYNRQGQVKSSAELDQFGEALFANPHRVNVNNTQNTVAVTNYTRFTLSHLVLLDENLILKMRMFDLENVVPGNTKVQTSYAENFCVNEVCFHGNDMIISEDFSRSIMLLSSQCVVLRTPWKDELKPQSFCFSGCGQLWCGVYKEGEPGVIKVLK